MLQNFVPLRNQPSTIQTSLRANQNISADAVRSRHGIEVEGDNVPDPISSFDEMEIPQALKIFLKRVKKISKPTPIQMQSISCLQHQRDIICLSATGTGKTYGYLLPLCSFLWKRQNNIHHQAQRNQQASQPLCLIIVPTRELVNQVLAITRELLSASNIFVQSSTNYGHSQRNGHSTPGPSHFVDNSSPVNHPPFNNTGGRALPNQWNFHPPRSQFIQQPINTPNYNQHPPYTPPRRPHPPYTLPQRPSYQQQMSNMANNVGYAYESQIPNANQQYANIEKIVKQKIIGLCGGTPVHDDVTRLNIDQHVVVIATPGRLLDLCSRNVLNLDGVRYFVIDECDRILDMGMEEQLRQIVAKVTINSNHDDIRTSLWSATLPESLERIARSAVIHPIYVCCGIKNSVPRNIQQDVRFLHTYQKREVLLDVLRQIPYPPVLVFTSSKDKVDDVTEFLHGEQFHAAALHSGYPQDYRNDVITSFRSDEIDILVATDLASRGLDVPTITHIINYDTPDTIEDYIHRVGRTGRFGRAGNVTTFLTLDCKIANELKELLECSNCDVPLQLRDVKMFGQKVLHTEMGDRVA
ncbi:probable ATP-dependent RNA helicase DDX41 [Clytia hemisphaerica]|uniref:RNA helicase n=1 Tax=Clytia hemisphaerica TaxID=252671 RepID=A0A7M5VBF3_9CNID